MTVIPLHTTFTAVDVFSKILGPSERTVYNCAQTDLGVKSEMAGSSHWQFYQPTPDNAVCVLMFIKKNIRLILF